MGDKLAQPRPLHPDPQTTGDPGCRDTDTLLTITLANDFENSDSPAGGCERYCDPTPDPYANADTPAHHPNAIIVTYTRRLIYERKLSLG